jgi:hypothetical protein
VSFIHIIYIILQVVIKFSVLHVMMGSFNILFLVSCAKKI